MSDRDGVAVAWQELLCLSAVAAPWYCMGDYGGAIARALPALN